MPVLKYRPDESSSWQTVGTTVDGYTKEETNTLLNGKAPAGYGSFGETFEHFELDDSDGTLLKAKLIEIANTIGTNNTYRFTFSAYPFVTGWPYFATVATMTNSNGERRILLDASSIVGYGFRLYYMENSDHIDEWKDVIWYDPPMNPNQIYCTYEHSGDQLVYKKMDSNGVIWWSTDQSIWKCEAERVGSYSKTESDTLLQNKIDASSGAGAHNAIYRGKYLGNSVTAEQYAAINDGTFDNLYIGDYWTIGGVNYRIAAFDYYYRSGDNIDITTHHITLVPDTALYSHVMNDTNTTDGGYVGSKMYTTGLANAKTTINNAFGSAHILTHRQYLCNAVSNGKPSGGSWYDSTVDLMTEQNVYGSRFFAPAPDGTTIPYQYVVDKSQYPLFAFRPDMIFNRVTYWLRDVVSAADFAGVSSSGAARYDAASYALGVRPAFSIKA